jgi:protein-tyrosine phosphatase
MVCLGNICRSPLAEGILKSKLPTDKFIVDSAGTGSWHVGHSQIRSIAVAKQKILIFLSKRDVSLTQTILTILIIFT